MAELPDFERKAANLARKIERIEAAGGTLQLCTSRDFTGVVTSPHVQ